MKEFAPMHLLVTGGAGFIGSNFIRWVLAKDANVVVTNLDLLTYAGNLESLVDVEEECGSDGSNRYRFVRGNIRDTKLVCELLRQDRGVDAVVHFAAESHVDRSILGPQEFVETNVNGTFSLLEAVRAELNRSPRDFRFLHVSTDEVYGDLGPADPAFSEDTPLRPNSPYAATKTSSDLLVRAYQKTFGIPALITRCSNNYGPYQFPEKLIPLIITRALANETLPVYGDGSNVRDWVHVLDHASAIWAVMRGGRPGEAYNIGGESELSNIRVVKRILDILGKPESLIKFVTDRPAHDRRYAMDIGKMRTELGWNPSFDVEAGLAGTVEWYVSNRQWWQRILNEAYRAASSMYLNAQSGVPA